MADMYSAFYNPDVLSCLANLSNDEVFTPPVVVNAMLDMLPQEIFRDSSATFLDPVCKTGVFLREIAKRLIDGLADEIPDLQQRVDHIFQKQLFGIAITEITSLLSRRSLYCSKYPNSRYSVSHFPDAMGNVRYKSIRHTWKNGKCVFCGASEKEYGHDENLETHAYEFIHTVHPERIFSMKFDVIIGNPPYHLDTGGAGKQAKPIYNLFVEQAKRLNPKHLIMIIPARWFAGGMGLDKFRDSMMSDNHIVRIVDYANAKECFPQNSIGGGVCYFLRERDISGNCEFTNISNGKKSTTIRALNEFPVLVRYNDAVSIIHKVKSNNMETLDAIVSSLMPYGLSTNYRGSMQKDTKRNITLYSSEGVSYISKSEITKGFDTVDKYKVLVSKTSAEHAGEPGKDGKFRVLTSSIKVILPGEVCTHSYFVVGCYDEKEYAENLLTYMRTKFVRFLILLAMSSINLSKLVFPFVPMEDFTKPWTDGELYKKYGLTEDEIAFIESMIKPME